jgi:hypothetical protein
VLPSLRWVLAEHPGTDGCGHSVGRAEFVAEIQLRLRELQFHEDRIPIRAWNEIHACVEQCVATAGHCSEDLVGRGELCRGWLVHPEIQASLRLKPPVDPFIGPRQHRSLAYRMTEHAAHIHESRLAFIVDAREVRLHHDYATCGLQSAHLVDGQSPLVGIINAISACIETGDAHSRLDDPGTALRCRPRLFRVHPCRRHHRNTAVCKVSQITLVRVPGENRCGVCQVRKATCPFEKRRTAWDVVPA